MIDLDRLNAKVCRLTDLAEERDMTETAMIAAALLEGAEAGHHVAESIEALAAAVRDGFAELAEAIASGGLEAIASGGLEALAAGGPSAIDRLTAQLAGEE